MNERELTARALNQLETHTGLTSKVTEYSDKAGQQSDITAVVEFNNDSKLVAQLKRCVNGFDGKDDVEKAVTQIIENAGAIEEIFVADYINSEQALRLRDVNINYLDRAGNAYLNLDPIFILIEGKTPKEIFLRDKTDKLFTETGLKVICALLTNDDLLNANYRTIADHAGVSMGTIGWVLRELRDQNFTDESYRKRAWKNKTKLIKKWVEEYPKLRNKNQLGTYYSVNKNWLQTLDLDKYDAVVGGELAAMNYGSSDNPREGLLYLGKSQLGNLIRDLNLVGVEERDNLERENKLGLHFSKIELRTKFWGYIGNKDLFTNSAHPLITHADLMDTWEPRNIQCAKQIASSYLFD